MRFILVAHIHAIAKKQKAIGGEPQVAFLSSRTTTSTPRSSQVDARVGSALRLAWAMRSAAITNAASQGSASNSDDQLYQSLIDLFTLDDLRELCFKMHISDEELAGDTKSAKIRSLILFCRRHGQAGELRQLARDLRPHSKL